MSFIDISTYLENYEKKILYSRKYDSNTNICDYYNIQNFQYTLFSCYEHQLVRKTKCSKK